MLPTQKISCDEFSVAGTPELVSIAGFVPDIAG